MALSLRQGDVDPAGALRFEAGAVAGGDEPVDTGEEIGAGAHSPIEGEHGARAVKIRAGETVPRVPAAQGVRCADRQESLMWAGGELIGRGFPDRPMVLSELIPCGLLTPVRGGSCLVAAQAYFLMDCFGDLDSGDHSKNRQRGGEKQGLHGHDENCATCEQVSATLMHMARH